MNKFVKNVFLAIMGVTVAFILYYICFGSVRWYDGGSIDGNGATVETDGHWMGLLYYMSAAVEVNLSRYYYEYCYIPEIHKNDGIDLDLVSGDNAYSISGSGVQTKIQSMYSTLYNNGTTVAVLNNNLVNPTDDTTLSYSSLELTPATADLDLTVPTTATYYYSTDWY